MFELAGGADSAEPSARLGWTGDARGKILVWFLMLM